MKAVLVIALVAVAAGCKVAQDLGSEAAASASVSASASSSSSAGQGGSGGSGGFGGASMSASSAGGSCASSSAMDAGANAVLLAVQPAATGWTVTFGETTPPCSDQNPTETMFSDLCAPSGDAVSFATRSTTEACCGCIGRQKAFLLAKIAGVPSKLDSDNAALHGTWFSAERSASDMFSLASLRIDLLLAGVEVGTRELAREQRYYDNCSASNQQHLIGNTGPFDLQLKEVESGVEFDEITIAVQGYGCGDASNSVALGDLVLSWVTP